RAAHELRDLLGRRRRRRGVAGRRPRGSRRRGFRDPRLGSAHAGAATAEAVAPARGGTRMSYVSAFGRFWWNFVVGDDWRVAVGLPGALALTPVLGPHRAA